MKKIVCALIVAFTIFSVNNVYFQANTEIIETQTKAERKTSVANFIQEDFDYKDYHYG